MSSMLETLKPSRDKSLPVSQSRDQHSNSIPLRRRLSSISLNLHRPISNSSASTWVLRKSKSMSSMGESAGTSVRKWWDWSWGWILSRKVPIFSRDLEMNEEESAMLGYHKKGTLSHVFYKVRFEIRKLMNNNKATKPQGFTYDSVSYNQNFDNGSKN